MKHILILVAMGAACAGNAQTFFTIHKGQIDPAPPLVTKRIQNVLGSRYSIDVHGFVGMRLQNSAGFAGGAATFPFFLGRVDGFGDVDAEIGVFGRAVPGERMQGGLFFGFRVR